MQKYNLALIDDDKSALCSIKYCLENDIDKDVNVLAYSNGADFLSDLQKKAFHLVVTDLEMPKITGIEIIQKIKSFKKSIPIIVLTGNTEMLRENLNIHKFIFEILIKPVEYDHLLRSIKDGLICCDFYNPPVSSKNSIDDSKASKKLISEILRINNAIKSKMLSNECTKKDLQISLDSQERLLSILKKSL